MRGDPSLGAPLLPAESTSCGLCGEPGGRPYSVTYDYEYGTCRNRWTFVECGECGNIYLNPRPSREALPIIYPPTYYSYNYDQAINWIARSGKAMLDRRAFRWMVAQLEIPLESYCDVGCGNGRYLRAIERFGLSRAAIHGTELDADVVTRLRDEGFTVENATIEDARLPPGAFQLMTLFSVLEHVSDPRAVLSKACELLAPGGLLVAEVPNPRSLNARIFRDRYWGGYHAPRHFNLFPLDALAAAGARAGLRLKTWRRTTGHAFWLFSLHHYVRFELGCDRVGRLLHPARCLPGVLLATGIDLLRARMGMETDNVLVVFERPRTL